MFTNAFTYRTHLSLSRIIAIMMVLLWSLPMSAGNHIFKESSALSSGTWVKIYIDQSGIYEISYEELQNMGFADPSKVGVFGKGGTVMPISFNDGTSSLVTDDLNPVGTWHNNSKLYFYGSGTEEIALNSTSALFEKKSRNIYSDKGAYFLSDSPESLMISPDAKSPQKITSFTLGYDYIYRENDLYQNSKRTGQLFWGEDLKTGLEVKESYHLPLIDTNSKAYLECKVYVADKSTGTMRYGVTEATGGNRAFNVVHPSPAVGTNVNPDFLPMASPVATLSLPSNNAEVYVRIDNPSGDFLNLDYWLMTYGKHSPDFSLSPFAQERFSIIRKTARAGKFSLPSEQNVEVFDVSDPIGIRLLPKETSGEETSFFFTTSNPVHDFIFCNLDREQLKVSSWEKVVNSDMHALAAKGADFLIITVPEYEDFAQRLAELHRRYDGMEVTVAVTSDLYNEFSGGIPDPMAYRAMTKMTYEASGGKLKNLLLVGRMVGDFRSVASREDSDQYLIAFQDLKVSTETDASMVMDFYGLTDDNLYTSLQNNVLQVGVGLLPFYSKDEADKYLRKVERYMSDNDKADYLNEFLSIGGVGDNHTHDTQGVLIQEHWDTYTPDRQINFSLPLDAFGEKGGKKILMDNLHRGKLLTSYFGHGDYRGPNSAYDFFRMGDLKDLKNEKSGFMLIMGCDLSDTDHLRKGFGEAVVTDSEYGMLGCMMAIRTSWSGQNFELAKLFSTALFASSEKVYDSEQPGVARTKYREESPTIGEVYSRAKTLSNYSNSLTYNYIGDPALVIPVPLRRISSSLPAKAAYGEIMKLKGTVWSADTIHLRDTLPIGSYSLPLDPDFNGKIVAKVLASDKNVCSNDYLSNSKADGKELWYVEKGARLAEFNGLVKNGQYDIDILIPEDIAINRGEKVQILLAAYDPSRKLGASGCVEVEIGESSASGNLDQTAPTISLSYNPSESKVVISLSDNMGLNPGGIGVEIDGCRMETSLTSASEDWRSIELAVNADRLSEGSHSLLAVVADQAGNKSEEALDFDIVAPAPTLSLSVDRKAVKDEILFSLENAKEGLWRIVITDSNGSEILKKSFSGDEFLWDCVASSGARVVPGLYNAVIVSEDNAVRDKFSAKVPFAVIE